MLLTIPWIYIHMIILLLFVGSEHHVVTWYCYFIIIWHDDVMTWNRFLNYQFCMRGNLQSRGQINPRRFWCYKLYYSRKIIITLAFIYTYKKSTNTDYLNPWCSNLERNFRQLSLLSNCVRKLYISYLNLYRTTVNISLIFWLNECTSIYQMRVPGKILEEHTVCTLIYMPWCCR